MAAIIDTNILVYCYDSRFPEQQKLAKQLLRQGIIENRIYVPHQVIVEFVAVMTRLVNLKQTLFTLDEVLQETDEILLEHKIIYPSDSVLRTALRGMALYQLSWFDAHLWAYAECNGLTEILSEDFQHGRFYGTVRTINPFLRTA